MKKFFVLGLATLSLGAALLSAAPAQAADYPMVQNLKPFSAECNYMSRAGYLRVLVFERDNVWLSRSEAVAIAGGQGTAAGE